MFLTRRAARGTSCRVHKSFQNLSRPPYRNETSSCCHSRRRCGGQRRALLLSRLAFLSSRRQHAVRFNHNICWGIPLWCRNHTQISPNSRPPWSLFWPIQPASYGVGSGALLNNQNQKKVFLGCPDRSVVVAESHHMVEHTQYRSYDPDTETYDAYDDDETIDYPVGSYKFGRSAKDHSVPLFLSDPEGEPDPEEFGFPLRKSRRLSISSKILASVLVAAAVAILFALFSSDDMRNIAVDAKASFAAVLPGPSVAAEPPSAQLTAKDVQLKDPARLSSPANTAAGAPQPNVQVPAVRSNTVVAMAPSRDDINTA